MKIKRKNEAAVGMGFRCSICGPGGMILKNATIYWRAGLVKLLAGLVQYVAMFLRVCCGIICSFIDFCSLNVGRLVFYILRCGCGLVGMKIARWAGLVKLLIGLVQYEKLKRAGCEIKGGICGCGWNIGIILKIKPLASVMENFISNLVA